MPTDDRTERWLELAEQDLASAKYLMTMYPKPLEIICYHCQQCVEKLLKCYLAAQGMIPPKVHDLADLCHRCMTYNDAFYSLADACAALTPYGVQVRYPEDIELTETDMKAAVKDAENVTKFIQPLLNQLLGQAEKPQMGRAMT